MGITAAIIIMLIWSTHLVYLLGYSSPDFSGVSTYLHILLQTYLFTGLFITAHDSMHGTITKHRGINKAIGIAASLLYAGMSYNKLYKNHMKHHKSPGTKDDPDFYTDSQNFFIWWFTFFKRYASILQLIIMAAVFNILKIRVPELNLWLFWVLPAMLSSLQLFYFGTYIPHKKPHTHNMTIHKARSQRKNHLWAMISCYFFGYHLEHHKKPYLPWWQLYKSK